LVRVGARLLGVFGVALRHRQHSLRLRFDGVVLQTGVDRAGGEHVRVRDDEVRDHRGTRREPGGVDARRVDVVVGFHLVDHPLDDRYFARVPGGVLVVEPLPAPVVMPARRLLGVQDDEPVVVRLPVHLRFVPELVRGLRAAV